MALINALAFTQNSSDIDSGVVTDQSDYSIGGNQARSETANYLLWSKTDQNGSRVFTNPNQGSVLSTLSYTVATLKDGYYEGILMRFGQYNSATAYVEQQESGGVVTQYASVFYYSTTGKVYQAIAPSTGQDPENVNFFAEVPDLIILVMNTNVNVFIQNFYIKARANQCANKKFEDSCGCGCDGDLSKISPALNIRYKIIAADAAFSNGNPELMDKIIRDVESTCSTC